MVMRRSAQGSLAVPQQVFKPRATVVEMSRKFPMLYGVAGALMAVALMVGYWSQIWLIPVMMAVPLASLVVGGLYTKRLTTARVIIDADRLRFAQGTRVSATLPWLSVTRLTIRQERGGTLYELWVKEKAMPLPAEFFEDGDKLVKAISARTNLPWEPLD